MSGGAHGVGSPCRRCSRTVLTTTSPANSAPEQRMTSDGKTGGGGAQDAYVHRHERGSTQPRSDFGAASVPHTTAASRGAPEPPRCQRGSIARCTRPRTQARRARRPRARSAGRGSPRGPVAARDRPSGRGRPQSRMISYSAGWDLEALMSVTSWWLLSSWCGDCSLLTNGCRCRGATVIAAAPRSSDASSRRACSAAAASPLTGVARCTDRSPQRAECEPWRGRAPLLWAPVSNGGFFQSFAFQRPGRAARWSERTAAGPPDCPAEDLV
jgi:hypothetical protein